MSCTDLNCSTNCDPCQPALTSQESVASELSNLITTLLGTFTKTIVNGRAVWGAPCSVASTGLTCDPRITGEGLICYLLRLISELGVFDKGVWDVTLSYCKHSAVAYNNKVYVAQADLGPGIQPDTNPASWLLWLATAVGPAGPQGIPGPAGSGSTTAWAVRRSTVDTALVDTDAVLLVTPGADRVIGVPAMATLTANKFFVVQNVDGAHNVTLSFGGGDTLGGAGTYVLAAAGETAFIVADAAGIWTLI